MDLKNDSEQNPFLNSYDDDHDSDLESRLYAEIHFSNNIIGEENKVIDSVIDNPPPNAPCISLNKTGGKKMDQHLQTQCNKVNNTSINDKVGLPSKGSMIIQNDSTNKTSETSTPQKRSTTKSCDKSSRSSKRRKTENINKSGSNELDKAPDSQVDPNKMINPYNKNVMNDPTKGMKLLSPEFLNLFFGKKNKKKLQSNPKQPAQNKTGNQANSEIQQRSLIQSTKQNKLVQDKTSKNATGDNSKGASITKKVTRNEKRLNVVVEQEREKEVEQSSLSDASSIIDISSESSKDSIGNNSKYNTTVATDKKLDKKKLKVMHTDSENSSSDSEESIFEVPVPPKPAPPVIEVKDSGSEHDSDSESDNSSSSSDSPTPQANAIHSKSGKAPCTTMNTTEDLSNIDSETNESDNIILNCTEIQKGVSSLSEVKRMSHQSSDTQGPTKEITHTVQNITTEKESSHDVNVCNTEKSQLQEKESNNSVSKKKVGNTSNNQQKSLCPSKKNISIEEYFFQPMNEKMKSFYNDSWGGENFDMDKLKSKMSSDPNKWAILNDDLVVSFSKRKRYFGMVCNRCQKDGHRANQCTEPVKVPTCHMCGSAGHIEIACPHKKCLTCGKKQNMYRKTCENCRRMRCSRCDSQGHMEYSCPDLWRRYHQTINKGDASPPKNLRTVMKTKNELYCCNCAKRGHVSESCNRLRWSQHFPNPECVTNYKGPPYFQDSNSSRNMNEAIESSFDRNRTCDSSFNFDSTLNSSIDLNSTYEVSPRIQRFATNPISATNMVEPRNTIIFLIKSGIVDETVTSHRYVIKLDEHDKYGSNNYDNWKDLSRFLNDFVNDTPSQFLLEQKGKQVQMQVTCVRKYRQVLSPLIRQYASRNNTERSHMLMRWDRRIIQVSNLLAEKMTEIKNLNVDPLQLYEEIRQLGLELMNKENRSSGNLEYSLKINRLALCQRNLLMALYKEGFIMDDSLKNLSKMHRKFVSRTQALAKPRKKPRNKGSTDITIKALLQYLYDYNNVFVPYERKDLGVAIDKCREHFARCDRLRNNPLLFPQMGNKDIANKTITFNETITRSEMSKDFCTPASTSHIPPLMQNYTAITTVNSTPSNNIAFSTLVRSEDQKIQNSDKEIRSKNVEHLKYLKKHPHGLYLESIQSKRKRPKTKLTKKFNNFIDETKHLILKAQELNIPHLHKHIDVLQKKMQNDIYVYEKDVKLLRKHVNEELKRRGEFRR